MKTEKQIEFIIMKDSKMMIFIDNILMIGGMFLLLDINYTRWNGSSFVTFMFIVMLFMIISSKGRKKTFTTKDKQKAIDYIKNLN